MKRFYSDISRSAEFGREILVSWPCYGGYLSCSIRLVMQKKKGTKREKKSRKMTCLAKKYRKYLNPLFERREGEPWRWLMLEDAAVVSKDKQRKKAGGNSLSSRKELAFFQREATVLNQSILASKTAGASLDISFSPVEVYRKQGWAQRFSTALFYSLSVCPSACGFYNSLKSRGQHQDTRY